MISTRHIAGIALAAVVLLCARTPAAAGPAGTNDPIVSLINQHLALLVATEQQPATRRLGPHVNAAGTRFATVSQAKPIHLAPFLLEMVGRYNRAERLLHFQDHGFDANFWGAIGGGRVRLRYSVKF